MRHGKRINSLGRTAPHRKAMLSNMATSLILHKRITTTVAKAKELRKYVEPLITRSKTDSTHSRRVVFSYLQDKDSVRELFDEVSEKVVNRPGGYTRIIKMGNRLGDNADMCMIELVDYNELLLEESKPSKAKTRRSRRGKKVEATAAAVPAAEVVEEVETKEEEVEAQADEIVDAEVVEEATEIVEEVSEVVEEASEVVEEATEEVEEIKASVDEKAEEENVEEKPSGKDDSKEEGKDTKKE